MTKTSAAIAPLTVTRGSIPCDHDQHNTPNSGHHGPATYYVRKQCPGHDAEPQVYAACQGFIDSYITLPYIRCLTCGEEGSAGEFVKILGPVPA